jgi:biotin carboxyl carrier protein
MVKAEINGRTFKITGDEKSKVIDGTPVAADILEYKNGKFHVIMDNRSYSAEIVSTDKETKTCVIKVGKSVMTVILKDKYDDLLHEMGIDEIAGKKVNDIKAPMPGMVLQIMVKNGQQIKKGDAIVVLEAMKMENILKSPADGIVKSISVTKGDKVEKNQVMLNLD